MKQVLDDILQAEKEAEEILRAARNSASQMTREAEIELNALKGEFREKVREMLQAASAAKESAAVQNLTLEDARRLCGVNEEEYRLARQRITSLICTTFADEGAL